MLVVPIYRLDILGSISNLPHKIGFKYCEQWLKLLFERLMALSNSKCEEKRLNTPKECAIHSVRNNKLYFTLSVVVAAQKKPNEIEVNQIYEWRVY